MPNRKRFTEEQIREFLRMADQPGAKLKEIALENSFHPTQFTKWRARYRPKRSRPGTNGTAKTSREKELEKRVGELTTENTRLKDYIVVRLLQGENM
jgi:transposase-like protein